MYLEFHKKCMESGRLPNNGLCFSLTDDKSRLLLKIMSPYNSLMDYYWGTDEVLDKEKKWYEYTPLRQTIVLFMAAMNGEL